MCIDFEIDVFAFAYFFGFVIFPPFYQIFWGTEPNYLSLSPHIYSVRTRRYELYSDLAEKSS